MLLGAVLVGLAGASAGLFGDVRGPEDSPSPLLGRIAFDVAAGVLLTYVLFAVGLTGWALLTGGRSGLQPRQRKRRSVLELFAVMAVFLLAAVGAAQFRDRQLDARGSSENSLAPPAEAGEGDDGPTSPATDLAIVGTVVLALAVGAAVVVARERRRVLTPSGTRLVDDEPVAVAADAAAVDLRAETDPRRAVVAAYLRMDATLVELGLGRRASEAPLEHLARVLDDAGIPPGSAHRLVELFERARFSSRPVDASMRAEALAHLEAIAAVVPA